MDLEKDIFDDAVPDEFKSMGTDDLKRRSRLLANEIRVLKVPPRFVSLHDDAARYTSCKTIQEHATGREHQAQLGADGTYREGEGKQGED